MSAGGSDRESAGIYVHLPYCRSRCEYCSFVVSTDEGSRESYLASLETEAALVTPEAEGFEFDTVYLGGGTPSLVPEADLAKLLGMLRAAFRIAPESEITMEANPDDVTPARADGWARIGVNRISLGVQSFSDRELAAVGRRHDAESARAAVRALLGASVSVSGDLILGLPEQTAASFLASADELAQTGAAHVSVYLLETEKSRSIEEDRRARPERYLSDDEQADLWLELGRRLEGRGFGHYEISNWARPGFAARHNLKYWRRVPTLGLGVSAHELWGGRRRANVASLSGYIEALDKGRRPTAMDRPLSAEEEAREKLMLGLRLAAGIEASELDAFVAAEADGRLEADYRAWRDEGLLQERSGRIAFTERGFLLSNEILCRFV
jgi:putative oxygen-independent coproporphyrinogen III oxidase